MYIESGSTKNALDCNNNISKIRYLSYPLPITTSPSGSYLEPDQAWWGWWSIILYFFILIRLGIHKSKLAYRLPWFCRLFTIDDVFETLDPHYYNELWSLQNEVCSSSILVWFVLYVLYSNRLYGQDFTCQHCSFEIFHVHVSPKWHFG